MLKKTHDYVLPIVFSICFILSFVFESQRLAVLIFGIIAFIAIFIMAFIFVFNMTDVIIDMPIVFISIIMIFFGNGKYNYEVFIPSKNNIGYILLSIIVIISIYKMYINQYKSKNLLTGFLICMIIFLMLITGCWKYFNYSFDLSEEINTECIIEKQLNDGHSLPGYDHVFIEYAVKSNDFNIKTINISNQFKLCSGDKVNITYRKGIYTPLYSTEYDVSMWIPSSLFID